MHTQTHTSSFYVSLLHISDVFVNIVCNIQSGRTPKGWIALVFGFTITNIQLIVELISDWNTEILDVLKVEVGSESSEGCECDCDCEWEIKNICFEIVFAKLFDIFCTVFCESLFMFAKRTVNWLSN